MPKRIVILAGAPEASVLSFSSAKLLDEFLPTFQYAIDGRVETAPDLESQSSACPAWRSISLDDGDGELRDRQSEEVADWDADKTMDFLSAANRTNEADFLDHSFAMSEDLTVALETSFSTASFGSMNDSLHSDASAAESSFADLSAFDLANDAELVYLVNHKPLTSLWDLPNSSQLSRLYPQTMTPNILAGIISVSTPRSVTVRAKQPGQKDRNMDIVELLVGDDTAAGFGMTFWLLPAPAATVKETQQRHADDSILLRAQLARMRRGDVVLFTNIALSTYNGKVYGQSLRRRGGAVSTGVRVIPIDLEERGNPGQGVQKLKKVREWTMNFVGIETEKGRGKRKAVNAENGLSKRYKIRSERDELPADTQ